MYTNEDKARNMNELQSRLSTNDEVRQSTPTGEEACNCEGNHDDSAPGCGCCGMSGRGGKLRIGLLVVMAIVVVVLLVQGFSAAS
jgi:hypothetical protein